MHSIMGNGIDIVNSGGLQYMLVTRADVTASACIVTECFATSSGGHMAPARYPQNLYVFQPD